MTLIDNESRHLATNPHDSYIVQAPAGSGKTEILTQRFLRLLSTVDEPEQIIALTFTRKAASEMRERIILALQQAQQKTVAKSVHQQLTLEFARQALNHSQQQGWSLLIQTNRLKIITIDSLCQSINQSIPLLEQQINYSAITDKPSRYYRNAARICIQYAIETAEYQPAIKTLLLHVDNKQERLIQLFSDLLSQRDQWMSLLFTARGQEKATFELALQQIENHELNRFRLSLPKELAQGLTQLSQAVTQIENDPSSPRYPLKIWHDFSQSTQEIVIALSQLLLGSDENLRNSFDHHVGFKKSNCDAQTYKQIKESSKQLLGQLELYPEFLSSLLQVKNLPKPHYNEEQWETLQALWQLLPLLVSHLHLLFRDHNEIDFTTLAQQALAALGDVDNPTDLALYLDHSIHHLLIDEFQDTSISQFELITQLVQGWQEGDGKTLFVVGDPMQSIYRFRQAEVGLFYRAKEQGIGPVVLNPLELRCNFRSTPKIVDWVNDNFSSLFPAQRDIEAGAVAFHYSTAVIPDCVHSEIYASQFNSRQQEATHLITQIQHEVDRNPQQTIAILVRSRTHLKEIIGLLREHQIAYQGTDIDLLSHLTHLKDVWVLTQALLAPGNRLVWLALLRSPYCGLSLVDLHLIAQFNKKKSIYSALLHLSHVQGLSEDGRARAQFLIQVMHKALAKRCQSQLTVWVQDTLDQLHGQLLLTKNQLQDLEQFWNLLDSYEEKGLLIDLHEFQQQFNALYSKKNNAASLQVMTIHKAKGLEFDTVFLPSLGSQPNRGSLPMLRWLKLPTAKQENILLVSPIQSALQDHCPLYHYLGQIDEVKTHYETQRLLYVAVTRAKSRLYLSDCSAKAAKKSFRSLLSHLSFSTFEEESASISHALPLPKLWKLPIEYFQLPSPQWDILPAITLNLSMDTPRLIGIITHHLLHWICDHHPLSSEQIPWHLAHIELKRLGLDKANQQSAFSKIKFQIESLFTCPIGAWIIAPHLNEQNELEILVEQEDSIVTRIIDRCFEEKNQLWIIDFKTGKEDITSLTQHQQQLNEYSRYLSYQSSLAIQCGLYYLANGKWTTWSYQTEQLKVSS